VVSLDAVGHPFHKESLDKWVDPFRVRPAAMSKMR
jgi:hypothetical protein